MSTFLVTQATGKQSGATIKHLLEAGAKVHAVVRNPDKVPAILRSPGVTIFQAEGDDVEALYRAARDCKGAYLNTFPIPGFEARQAQAAVDACKRAGIETIVVSSSILAGAEGIATDAAASKSGLAGYYASKVEVEQIVRGAGLAAYTILRPGVIHYDYLAENSGFNYPELIKTGTLRHTFNDGAGIPHTVADDIGKYAAAALQNPAKFGGEEIELGNENLHPDATSKILSRVSGRDVKAEKRGQAEAEEVGQWLFGQKFFEWANLKVPELKTVADGAKDVQVRYGIPFTSMESALSKEREAVLAGLPA
ncbi:putative NmrA-like family protein [Colletotrichum tofieldiae]|uniref:Putative NmrA-like family protein n=1 Tax=Colletotrichum tofieldiae TaxID=708197 RepID=A0A166TSE0_9PEZI|nr:putative NmrA-like family protein [Colletotrichum tofieldiae]GKT56692.1 putative NmrA-like family protein [Colletotrichum tofieldiae]GKT76341.1 putative NmrA-like family protein [Colletotrichum tofieldiae]